MDIEDINRMWNYRRENFIIKVDTELPSAKTYNRKSITFMLSGNGSQFSVITVYGKEELIALADVINEAVAEFDN